MLGMPQTVDGLVNGELSAHSGDGASSPLLITGLGDPLVDPPDSASGTLIWLRFRYRSFIDS